MIRGSIPLTFAALLATTAVPAAQGAQAPLPTLTIARFDADPRARIRADDQDALADELGARLVESGQYRVLGREFLPVRRSAEGTASVAALRQAARDAGIEYLVLGSVRRISIAVSRPTIARTLPALPGLLRPSSRGFIPRPRTVHQSFLDVTVRLVDVSSGQVVRTAFARAPASPLDPGLRAAVETTANALIAALPALHK